MGLIDRVLKPVVKPVADTYNAVAQLAGHKAPAPMQRNSQAFKLAQQGAKMGYQFSPLAPYMQFAANPNVGNLAMAAMSFLPGAASANVAIGARPLARSLHLGLDAKGLAEAANIDKQINSKIIPFKRDIRQAFNSVLQDPSKGIQPGGFYRINPKLNYTAFNENRTAMIQDPMTGTIFAAPGAVHGELINHVHSNYPQFNVGHPHRWMQHEVYGPEDFGHGLDPVPARILFETVDYGHKADTRTATMTRARLVQALAKIGVRQDEGLAAWLANRNTSRHRPR